MTPTTTYSENKERQRGSWIQRQRMRAEEKKNTEEETYGERTIARLWRMNRLHTVILHYRSNISANEHRNNNEDNGIV